ncbi:MAG: oligosaccharide flippase family protein [Sulfurovum sp.]|nr:oligosaccharide flippase family protein [Sulfurovum sp.]
MTQTNDTKKLINNFFSLFIVQGSNFIVPLIAFPYIVQVIGLEKFGLLAFATAFISYPLLLVTYGLDLSGVREVSSAKHSKRRLSTILSSILLTRLILTLIAAFVTFIIVISFDRFYRDWLVYLFTFGSIIATMMFPVWFFQGMEKMKFITYLTIGSKILYLIGIFVFVRSEEDFIFVPFLNFITLFFVGVISLIVIKREFDVSFILPRIKYIYLQFIKGWHLFVSHLAINFFTSFNMLILGLVSSDLIVGYYALAEKIVKIITSLFSPLNQALFPHVVQMVKHSKEKGQVFVTKFSLYIFAAALFIWVIFFVFSENIFGLVFGKDAINSIPIFNILSVLIVIMPLAAWLYNVILISYKLEKYFVKIFSTVAVINIVIIAVLLPWFESKVNVIAFSLVFSEAISLVFGFYLYKRKITLKKVIK